jgi:diguanylate cyclase (GGDEF)-like protein
MWIITVHSPWSEPREYVLKAVKIMLGRHPGNDIAIVDDSASRLHAEIEYNVTENSLVLRDQGSTNGTFVNRERVTEAVRLRPDDQIRIGQHRLLLAHRDQRAPANTARLAGTQPLTRDLVLHSVDQHALVLYEVANRLNTIMDLDTALAEASRLTQTGMAAARCEVVPVYRFEKLGQLDIPAEVVHQAVDQRSVLSIADLATDQRYPRAPGARTDIHSVLCVPGTIGDEVMVLTYAYRAGAGTKPFEERDVHLAVAISHQAALTIQRSLLLERRRHLEQLAALDSLTGVNNQRYFFEVGDKEFKRARRYRRPLSGLLLDIQNFKQYNEQYGHAVGDQLLRAVATCCRERLREGHLLARYGGDEFAVLLLECDLSDALRVAERLQQGVNALSIDTRAGPLTVRLLAGCATMDETVPDLQTLITRAEANMVTPGAEGAATVVSG